MPKPPPQANINQLDTGKGGFDVDGKTYSYDVGLSDKDGGAQGNYDKGNIKVDDNIKDISTPTKKTLGQYMSDVTKGKKGSALVSNVYPVDPPSQEESSLIDDQGYPQKLGETQNSAKFIDRIPSAISNDYSEINGKFKKGLGSSQVPDGNTLLSGKGDDGKSPSPIDSYVSKVLSRNRFTPNSLSIFSSVRKVKHSTLALGNYSPVDGVVSDDVNVQTLGRIGATLSTRASIELLSGNDGYNVANAGAEAGALLPGVAQLALRKIDSIMLTAEDVFNSVDKSAEDLSNTTISPASDSWGQLNNVLDQFSGLGNVGMVATSLALVGAIEILFDVFGVLFGLIKSDKKPAKDDVGRHALGSYYFSKGPKDSGSISGMVSNAMNGDIGSMLGIHPTYHNFGNCLSKGTKAFFGIKDGGGILGAITSAIANSSENPGFNAVMCRTIIRSGVVLVEKMKGLGGNPISVVKGIMDLIDVIRSSKIIAACNVFAQIGDQILSIPEEHIDQDALGAGIKISMMDTAGNTNSVQKSRLKDSLKLAWASNRAPSTLLLPSSVIAAAYSTKNLDANDLGLSTNDSQSNQFTLAQNESRISSENVEKIEAALDAEYVPFYFHDIRTNEIIGFHAFLESLTDDYTANYESMDTYGRVDPVRIYKSTGRRLGLSFRIVSTSPSDFNEMWMKINKLTTLVYPQYTAGRFISDGDKYAFRQPFSQMISASPMIRLRVGDLLRSNYSKFNLGRLFGLGESTTKINGTSAKSGDDWLSGIKKLQDYINEFHDDLTYNPVGNPNGNLFIKKSNSVGVPSPLAGDKPKYSSTFNLRGCPSELIEITPTGIISGDETTPKQVVGKVAFTSMNEIYEKYSADQMNSYLKLIANDDDPSHKIIDGEYIFDMNELKITRKSFEKLSKKFLPDPGDFPSDFLTFMGTSNSSTGNAIARSFKTVGGKGIAGFIDSMNFDWYDRTPWEIEYGSVAPKMCKVTLAFTPIHDITPGIDSTGYNRAPIYPVGSSGPSLAKKG